MGPPGVPDPGTCGVEGVLDSPVTVVHLGGDVMDQADSALVLRVGFGSDGEVHGSFEELLVRHGSSH